MNSQQPYQPTQEARSASFRRLKPICITLSEIALNPDKHKSQRLNTALESLLDELKIVPVLDAKLADYSFFPLSYVIKEAQKLPARSLSLAVSCLEILIRRGWQTKPDPNLTRELLIFLTIQLSTAPQDDLVLSLLTGLATLLSCMSSTVTSLCKADHKDNTAAVGQLIDTFLSITKDSPAIEIQYAAVSTLDDLTSILDAKVLRMFLPGIVSQLSNVLRSPTKRTYRVLVKAVHVLDTLIKHTLSDHVKGQDKDNEEESWRKATASQLTVALANIVPLRYHTRTEVLDAFATLCITILDDCRVTLEDCRSIMLESLCIISSQDVLVAKSALDRLATNDTISTAIQELSLRWLQSLPRKLQAQDIQTAERHTALICESYRVLRDSDADVTSLDRELLIAIEDSARTLLLESTKPTPVDDVPNLSIRDLVVAEPISKLSALGTLSTSSLKLLDTLIQTVQPLSLTSRSDFISDSSSLASLWVLSRSLSDQIHSDASMQDFVLEPAVPGEILEIALTRAIDILTEDTGDTDWRLQAISLEIFTLVAQQEGEDFRTSLVDTLFPMVQLLGASDPFLRQYAISAISAVSYHCGYNGPGDMIVQNVDYLVNAIALKFNTFDVNPQAPQVIVLMLELSGPTLIPYLDDLVDSMFGALAAYHGYPRFVEAVFSALASLVKHGSSNVSSIMDLPRIEHKKQKRHLTQLTEIPGILAKLRKPREDAPEEESVVETDTALDKTTPAVEEDQAKEPPKVYTMVQSVLRLSQHYLTHSEPYLRQRLLELVSIGCGSLSRNEDQFLPLVNDIWPVVIRRIYDEEPIVALAAMQALTAIFAGAGHFVSTRMQHEWDQIRSLYRALDVKAAGERSGQSNRGIYAWSERLLEGMIDMLVQMVMHVRVKQDMEDDLFTMLGPLAGKRQDVRDALEMLNEDELWLVLDLQTFSKPTPMMAGFEFVDVHSSM